MTRLKLFKDFLIELFEHLHNGDSMDQKKDRIREFISVNEGSLDAIFAKSLLCQFLISEGRFKEAEKIISVLNLTGNTLIDIFILHTFGIFYRGINDPSIDLNKSKKFYDQALDLTQKIVFQDQWEKELITAYTLGLKIYRTENQAQKLELITNLADILQKSEFKYSSIFFLNNVGFYYAEIGHFNEAINIYKICYEAFSKSDNSILFLNSLIENLFNINEIEQAKQYLSLAIEKATNSTNYFLKEMTLKTESLILEHDQRYDDLEISLIKHLKLAKKYKNPLKVAKRDLDLLSFYLNRYRSTGNNSYLEKAKNLKEEFQIIADETDDITTIRFNNYAKAMLLSLGSLKQKAQAVEIYEELIKLYPKKPSLKLELIELYWDDLKFDIDGESKKQIDQLLAQLQNISYVHYQNLDNSNVSLIILQAKYDFYINQKKDQVLESLYSFQSKAHFNGLKLIEDKVTREIESLEDDLDWNSKDFSIKERLDKVKMKSYIEGAQILLDKNL